MTVANVIISGDKLRRFQRTLQRRRNVCNVVVDRRMRSLSGTGEFRIVRWVHVCITLYAFRGYRRIDFSPALALFPPHHPRLSSPYHVFSPGLHSIVTGCVRSMCERHPRTWQVFMYGLTDLTTTRKEETVRAKRHSVRRVKSVRYLKET